MYLLRCITHMASLAKKRVSPLETKINTLKMKILNYFRKKYEYFKPGSYSCVDKGKLSHKSLSLITDNHFIPLDIHPREKLLTNTLTLKLHSLSVLNSKSGKSRF